MPKEKWNPPSPEVIVFAVLDDPTHRAQDGIDMLKDCFPQIDEAYELHDGTSHAVEQYGETKNAVEHHTRIVVEQFMQRFPAKYFESLPGNGLTRSQFELMLLLHDVGKGVAFEKDGHTKNQNEHTMKIVRETAAQTNLPERAVHITEALTESDPLGGALYIVDQEHNDDAREFADVDAESVAEEMRERAEECGMDIQQYFPLQLIYFMSDSLSYTEQAGHPAEGDWQWLRLDDNDVMNFQPHYRAVLDAIAQKLNVDISFLDRNIS